MCADLEHMRRSTPGFSCRNNTEKYKYEVYKDSSKIQWDSMAGLENYEQLVYTNHDRKIGTSLIGTFASTNCAVGQHKLVIVTSLSVQILV